MIMSQKLVILAGLPGSGKSTLAEGLSRHFSLPLFSVDPIEAAMWRGGLPRDQTGIAAYTVAQALADEHLRLGQSVVIDAVNPVEAPRAAWRNLAARYRADLAIHRMRLRG
jgi:predicted kinase